MITFLNLQKTNLLQTVGDIPKNIRKLVQKEKPLETEEQEPAICFKETDLISINGIVDSVENFLNAGVLRQIDPNDEQSYSAGQISYQVKGLAPQVKEEPPQDPPSEPLTLIARHGREILEKPPYNK